MSLFVALSMTEETSLDPFWTYCLRNNQQLLGSTNVRSTAVKYK